jgi:radical SAM protein with 4Fe4S-binding SPASM domain
VRIEPVQAGGHESRVSVVALSTLKNADRASFVVSSQIPKGPCFWAGNALCIDPYGSAWPCLLSHDEQAIFGNLLKEPVWEVVNRARSLRARIATQGRIDVRNCRDCRKQEGDAHSVLVTPPRVAQAFA